MGYLFSFAIVLKPQFMKHVIFTLLLSAVSFMVSAQCDPDLNFPTPGFKAPEDSCAQQGVYEEFVWQFKNFDIAPIANASVDSMRIDSINFLPCGFTWATNKDDNKFLKNENGCILIYGSTTQPAGEYTTSIIVSAWIDGGSTPLRQPSSVLGLYIKLRVSDGTVDCAAATTPRTSDCEEPVLTGVRELGTAISGFNNFPNPFNTYTNINFTAKQASVYSFKVFNTLGTLVHERTVDVASGANSIRFDRAGLDAGVYLYSLQNDKGSITETMVITK